jgi:hypothetical protein
VEVKTFLVVGDYADKPRSKPTDPSDVPDILDADGAAINTFMVLEDPSFPLIVSDDTVQSAISGRIIDSVTGDGIADAQVTVKEAGIAATTWPDGRFVLPVLQQPYGKFSISVEAKGYRPVATGRDFRQADAFPLNFKLDRSPQGDAWVGTSRARRLIGDATAEGRVVWIPTFPTYYPYGRTDAWIEIDPSTYEVYGRLTDGLYGSTLTHSYLNHHRPTHFSRL